MDPSTIVAILLFLTGALLLLHHGYKHSRDGPDALVRRESCLACCFFQLSDISNHETWILLCFTNASTILLMHASMC